MRAVILGGTSEAGLAPCEQPGHFATLPVANVPLIVHSISLLNHVGIRDITVGVDDDASDVQRIVRERHGHDMRVSFCFERKRTGIMSILRRQSILPGEPILIMMGDIFIEDLDLATLLNAHNDADAVLTLLAIRREQNQTGYGGLILDERRRLAGLTDDQNVVAESLVNTGMYMLDPAIVDLVPAHDNFQLDHDLLPALIEQKCEIAVVETGAGYRRISDARQYWQLNTDLVAGRMRPGFELLAGPVKGRASTIHPTAIIDGPVLIGSNCRVGRDVVVRGPAVIGDDVLIGRGAILDEVVVLSHTAIGMATTFHRSVLFDDHVSSVDSLKVVNIHDQAVLRSTVQPTLLNRFEQAVHSVIALLLLLLLLPLLLLVALAIRMESPGPVWYTQLRVGQRRRGADNQFYPGRVFEFIKFRSMYVDADQRIAALAHENEYRSGTFLKIRNDPRVTRVGRVIRKASIDELPQLINVIKGDMRLVGNRPLPLYEAANFSENWQKLRFNAPAGMTGLWQISGRSDLSWEERVLLDNFYAVSRSFSTDIKILLLTIPALLFLRGSR